MAVLWYFSDMQIAKEKKKAKIQTQGMLMPKAELFCLEEMLVVACQMNIHSWDALMEMPRHWRRQKSCWKDLKRIPAFFSSYKYIFPSPVYV